jgi:hypothetical protein
MMKLYGLLQITPFNSLWTGTTKARWGHLNFINSLYHLNEFRFKIYEFTILTSLFDDFSFTNSRFQHHEYSRLQFSWFNFMNSRFQLFWNFEFVKLKSWIHEVEYVTLNSWKFDNPFMGQKIVKGTKIPLQSFFNCESILYCNFVVLSIIRLIARDCRCYSEIVNLWTVVLSLACVSG